MLGMAVTWYDNDISTFRPEKRSLTWLLRQGLLKNCFNSIKAYFTNKIYFFISIFDLNRLHRFIWEQQRCYETICMVQSYSQDTAEYLQGYRITLLDKSTASYPTKRESRNRHARVLLTTYLLHLYNKLKLAKQFWSVLHFW